MSSTTSPIATSKLQSWLNRPIETLWLFTVFSVPLAFFDRDYAKSEAVIKVDPISRTGLGHY